jgi:hypothetical protein
MAVVFLLLIMSVAQMGLILCNGFPQIGRKFSRAMGGLAFAVSDPFAIRLRMNGGVRREILPNRFPQK